MKPLKSLEMIYDLLELYLSVVFCYKILFSYSIWFNN